MHSFHRAVFLQQEETLIEHGLRASPSCGIRLLPSVLSGLRLLATRDYALVAVQREASRGLRADPGTIATRVRQLLAPAGLDILAFLAHPSTGRQHPMPACDSLREAAQQQSIDLPRSWIVAGTLDDIEAGHRAGCRAVLIDNGHEHGWRWSRFRTPEHVARNFLAAARYIERAAEHAPRALYRRHAELRMA